MKKTMSKLNIGLLLLGGLALSIGTLSGCSSNGSSQTGTNGSSSITTSTTATTKKDLTLTGITELTIGGRTTLSVKSDGSNISETVTFTSSDTSILTVTSTGTVTAVAVGSATITATASGYNDATISISVVSTKQDITISITPTFASGSRVTEIEEGYGIFFASSLDNWVSHPATLNTDTEKWEITFTEVDYGQIISYNTYYSKLDGNGFDYINTESVDNSSRSLDIQQGVLSYDIDSTFYLPTTIDTLTYHITISIEDGAKLNDDVYVYVGSNANNWTLAKAEYDNTLGVWVYTDSNVDLGYFQYSICLGSETSCDWTYEYKGVIENITDDMEIAIVTATFKTQPDYNAAAYDYTFTLIASDAKNAADVKIVIDGSNWILLTAGENNSYTTTVSLTTGSHTFYFYNWYADVEYKIYKEAPETTFTVEVSETGSVTVNGSFDTGLGTIAE